MLRTEVPFHIPDRSVLFHTEPLASPLVSETLIYPALLQTTEEGKNRSSFSPEQQNLITPYSELERLKPSLLISGEKIFPHASEQTGSREYEYTSRNGCVFRVGFDRSIPCFPIADNFGSPGFHFDTSSLSSILSVLQSPPENVYDSEIDHELVGLWFDANLEKVMHIISPGMKDTSQLQSFVETKFPFFGAPDRVVIAPDEGIYIFDQYHDSKSDSRSRRTQKTKQMRNHIKGMQMILDETYGEAPKPQIIPVFLKFREAEDHMSIVIRPYLRRDESNTVLPLAS